MGMASEGQGGTLALVPWPVSVTQTVGSFTVRDSIRLDAEPQLEGVATLLRDDLTRATGLPLSVGTAADSGAISLRLDASLPAEAYRLTVDPTGVAITGGDPAGVYYGTQTLRQLLPAAIFGGASDGVVWEVPGVEIDDRPAFGWRGSMLDVGRHFMPKEFVLRYIDLLALHKLNVLHLHLSEDQGWRVEIKRYPKLTEVGSWRPATLIGRPDSDNPERDQYDGVPHGGFYTQDDLRDIVDYAAKRFVRVMPEIDLPGHSQAAIAAYPELGNTGEPIEVQLKKGRLECTVDAKTMGLETVWPTTGE